MTTRYKTQAFIFKKSDRNETDRVFSVFTDDFGRLEIHAKAIRKMTSKLRGGIDSFFLSEVEFIQGKNKKTLTDAVALEKFSNISQGAERFRVAHKIGEVLGNFIRGEEKDEKIFGLLSDVFYKLNDAGLKEEKIQLVYYYFLWNILSLLGYHPEVEVCGSCRGKADPYSLYFSEKVGGIVCRRCSIQAKKINSDIVKILRLILKKDWPIFSRLKVESGSRQLLKEISDNYYSYILSSHSFGNNVELAEAHN